MISEYYPDSMDYVDYMMMQGESFSDIYNGRVGQKDICKKEECYKTCDRCKKLDKCDTEVDIAEECDDYEE